MEEKGQELCMQNRTHLTDRKELNDMKQKKKGQELYMKNLTELTDSKLKLQYTEHRK